MNEHASELVPVLGYVIVALMVALKGLLILGYRSLLQRLAQIQISIDAESRRMHNLEIRVAKIETKLGIENHATQ